MKTVIFLSGKRYSGKNTFANKLKEFYENNLKTVKIVSISEPLKRNFCEMSGLPIEKFLSNSPEDHAFKNSHKKELNDFFKKTDPMMYIEMMKTVFIQNFDVFIVDDLRFKSHIDFINNSYRQNYKIRFVRINSLFETKIKRGWTPNENDNETFESELDTYANFDLTVDNDFGENHLFKVINTNKHIFI